MDVSLTKITMSTIPMDWRAIYGKTRKTYGQTGIDPVLSDRIDCSDLLSCKSAILFFNTDAISYFAMPARISSRAAAIT